MSAFTTEQIHQYLAYIGYPVPNPPLPLPRTIKTLTALIRLNEATLPFSNLGLHYTPTPNPVPSLKPVDLFNELVASNAGKGGYCMQLNTLFLHLLLGVGFDGAWSTGGRASYALMSAGKEPEGFGGWGHMILIVPFPEEKTNYMVDVGLGGVMVSAPLRLSRDAEYLGVEQERGWRLTRGPISHLRNKEPGHEYWQLETTQLAQAKTRDFLPVYAFSDQVEWHTEGGDYDAMNYNTAAKPGTLFTDHLLVIKGMIEKDEEGWPTEMSGRLNFLDNGFIQRFNDGREAKPLGTVHTEEERVKALRDILGAKLTEEEIGGIKGRTTELKQAVTNGVKAVEGNQTGGAGAMLVENMY